MMKKKETKAVAERVYEKLYRQDIQISKTIRKQ